MVLVTHVECIKLLASPHTLEPGNEARVRVTLHAGVTQKNLGVAWGRDYYMQGSHYKAAQD